MVVQGLACVLVFILIIRLCPAAQNPYKWQEAELDYQSPPSAERTGDPIWSPKAPSPYLQEGKKFMSWENTLFDLVEESPEPNMGAELDKILTKYYEYINHCECVRILKKSSEHSALITRSSCF